MKFVMKKERFGWLFRAFGKSGEVAYLSLSIQGLCAQVEFPSDWHERARVWVRLGFGIARLAFSLPWKRVVPDEYQCSGPTYGFLFFDDGLHLHWGKCKGKRDDPFTVIGMPWRWRHKEHKILSEKQSYPYRYLLSCGEVQERIATINAESRLWIRPWIPFRKLSRSINVEFDKEVGERSGSWKGGVLGCGYEMKRGETPQETLRRMERERVFR